MKILYIENNLANTLLMRKIIGRLSTYHLYDSPDAESGLELMVSLNPRVVLMDIDLPGMDGIQALKEIRHRFDFAQKTPVIAVTADAMPAHIELGLEQGFFDYITKPIDINKLVNSLESATKMEV